MDNTATLAENKVLILYILNQIKEGTSENGLYKIISSINDLNYFLFKDILMDLINSKLIGVYYSEDEGSILKITTEGKDSLSLTLDVLPGLLKLKADTIFKDKLKSVNNESSVVAEFTPRDENDYIVKCKIVDNNETIFEVKTFAGSRERAKKIVDNWNKNASKVYPKILEILLKNF